MGFVKLTDSDSQRVVLIHLEAINAIRKEAVGSCVIASNMSHYVNETPEDVLNAILNASNGQDSSGMCSYEFLTVGWSTGSSGRGGGTSRFQAGDLTE